MEDRFARMMDDGKARGKKGRGLRSEVRCQKTESREKGIEIRRRRSVVRPKGSEARGQTSEGRDRRPEIGGQVDFRRNGLGLESIDPSIDPICLHSSARCK